MTTPKTIKSKPDRAKGEYLAGSRIRICKACAGTTRRHTCGLANLQSMFRF